MGCGTWYMVIGHETWDMGFTKIIFNPENNITGFHQRSSIFILRKYDTVYLSITTACLSTLLFVNPASYILFILFTFVLFLVPNKRLYIRVCPSVRRSICPSVARLFKPRNSSKKVIFLSSMPLPKVCD